ncbi:MAG: XTP/dITP diphosphatase [Clostridia bacterium]
MKKKKLVIATNNRHKMQEISSILEDSPYKAVSMESEGIFMDPEESGNTFAENALIKAKAVSLATGHPVVADDSGLMVDCLGGAPGVLSKRYSGPQATDQENNRLLIENIRKFPPESRTARFVCNMAFVRPGGTHFVVEGSCEGIILLEPRGSGGFGYDPVFFVSALGKTFAELSMEEKNKVSHRAKALMQLKDRLEEGE